MKKLLPILLVLIASATPVLLVGGVLSGCKTEQLPLDTQTNLRRIEAEAKQAEADLLAAQAAGDTEAAMAAETRLAALEREHSLAIKDGASRNVHSLFELFGLSAFPGGPLVENLVTAGSLLAFKRQRLLLKKFVKGLNPKDKSVTLMDGLAAIPAAVGLVHSTPNSGKVAEVEVKAGAEAVAPVVERAVGQAS